MSKTSTVTVTRLKSAECLDCGRVVEINPRRAPCVVHAECLVCKQARLSSQAAGREPFTLATLPCHRCESFLSRETHASVLALTIALHGRGLPADAVSLIATHFVVAFGSQLSFSKTESRLFRLVDKIYCSLGRILNSKKSLF
jgi:hypothetical protein